MHSPSVCEMDRLSKTLEILWCGELLLEGVLLLQYKLIGPLSRWTIYIYPSVCPNADIYLYLLASKWI